MVSFPKPRNVAVIPLQRDSLLLPGIVLRIPLANRPDVPSLLTHVYSLSKTNSKLDAKSIVIGCVPVRSPLLTADGKRMIGSGHDEAIRPVADAENARKGDLYGFGTLARIIAIENRGTKEVSIVVEGLARFRIDEFESERPYLMANVSYVEEQIFREDDAGMRDLFHQLKTLSGELLTLLRLSSLFPKTSTSIAPILARRLEQYIARKTVRDSGVLADFMANLVETSYEDKLILLSAWDVKERVEKAIELISKQITSIKGNLRVTTLTTNSLPVNIDKLQFNRNNDQLARNLLSGSRNNGIFGGGGDQDEDEGNELEDLKKKLDDAGLSDEAEKIAHRELKRLKKMNPAQAEYQVCRNYLEALAEIPWTRSTNDHFTADTLTRARKQLDDDHYGLEKIKKRLLEYLAVLKLKQQVNSNIDKEVEIAAKQAAAIVQNNKPDEAPRAEDAKVAILKSKKMTDKSPIMLLVGPPGVGKTSLARSVAQALGRKFHRISLGGVRDEAEIRGHRRTYVAAMPGIIVNGLKKVGVNNPVFLLDEIDKIGGANFQGDPSAAMLEVLDPEQNSTFVDHYVNIPIDLSKVLFIATANSLDTIPGPLLDRMETIALSGYTTLEKRHIASQHLVPKQVSANGLQDGQVVFSDDVIDKIATAYTRESGVRNLEREIGSVCRYKAVEYADAVDSSKLSEYDPKVTVDALDTILGIEKFEDEIAEQSSRPGIVTGLVAYGSSGNGGILFIEVADMPGSGRVQLTGKLGDVLKESVEVALTWVKAHAFELGLSGDPHDDIMKSRNIHVHCPSGAIPKDGPSAGLAHTIALISLFSGKSVPPSLAMTGEISLRGRVMPVGGIKEKLIGAMRAGCKTVLIPEHNKKDLRDLPSEVIDGLDIICVRHIREAMRHVWPEAQWPGAHHAGIESQL